MKVLLISLSNTGGGASKIVSMLHYQLVADGYHSELVIFNGIPGDNITILNESVVTNLLFRIKNYLAKSILFFFKKSYDDYLSINIFPSNLLNFINRSDADIVHFHWVGAEMISIKQISKINKKIIWTMHDAWPLNGMHHVDQLDYAPAILLNESNIRWNLLNVCTLKRKKKYLANRNIVFTAPSNWLKNKFDNSFYSYKSCKCLLIPNFIDFEKWYPQNKYDARNNLNIKTSKFILVFGANNAEISFNKGFHYLKELMGILPKDKFAFLIFGNRIEPKLDFGHELFFMGEITNQDKMRDIYSAGDITIVPSLSESFSLVSLESIACNTPAVAFNSSGIIDIIKHKENGYLAEKFDVNSLKEGVEWLISNKLVNLPNSVSGFAIKPIIQQYKNLYKEVHFGIK